MLPTANRYKSVFILFVLSLVVTQSKYCWRSDRSISYVTNSLIAPTNIIENQISDQTFVMVRKRPSGISLLSLKDETWPIYVLHFNCFRCIVIKEKQLTAKNEAHTRNIVYNNFKFVWINYIFIASNEEL